MSLVDGLSDVRLACSAASKKILDLVLSNVLDKSEITKEFFIDSLGSYCKDYLSHEKAQKIVDTEYKTLCNKLQITVTSNTVLDIDTLMLVMSYISKLEYNYRVSEIARCAGFSEHIISKSSGKNLLEYYAYLDSVNREKFANAMLDIMKERKYF